MIGSSENRVSYNGNGKTTEFPFGFKILEKSDLKIVIVDEVGKETPITADYYIDMEHSVVRYPGYSPGAEPPVEEQPPKLQEGLRLVIYRDVPITQETALDEHWPFNVIEYMADKLTIICQQIADGINRCFRVSSATARDVETTIPVSPGKSFRWSDDGKRLEVTEDPAQILPLANSVLGQTEALRNEAEAFSTNADQQADYAREMAETAIEQADNATQSAKAAEEFVEEIKKNFSGDALAEIKTATVRKKSTTYSVGNVVYTDTNLSVALKCTTVGTTSNTELDISGNNVGDTVTDGGVVWQVCNRTSDVTSVNGKTGDVVVDLPVGHMYWSVEPNVPAGRLPALGATYNRALYADLWAWANNVGLVKTESEWQAIASANGGNCAYYSSGNGSTTFRVPALKCWVKGASGVEEVGNYLEAGLPNIEGTFTGASGHNEITFESGATIGTGRFAGGWWYHADFNGQAEYSLDASRSNSIYGNSDTVQPPSIVGMWLIVAFGVAHNIGEADVANVMQAVEQVQTGLGTLEQGVGTAIDYIIESYRNGTEWYEVYKSGKVRQGGKKQASSGTTTVTLLKGMADTNFFVLGNFYTTATDTGNCNTKYVYAEPASKNTVLIGSYSSIGFVKWYVEGQGA